MNKKPLLVIVRGLPGSGKSYLSEAVSKKLDGLAVTLLDPDVIKTKSKEFLEFSQSLSEEGLAEAIHPFRWLRKNACDAITANKIVIWNQPFTIRGIFDRLLVFIMDNSEHDRELDILVVEISIDNTVALERIEKRKNEGGHGPSNDTFEKRVSEYESFSDSYDTLKLNGSDDIDENASLVADRINAIIN